ncbi:related to peptidyl-prolyl cis-trans isomerase D [Desulfotalea psychrophila LSv54]|uniref:Periplasmic chaperone PpiD n=2 Tax=Desulfotalea psychrophila TaxID=84980 RepID=Q6APJ9_DESPS|nr:related to peptidyl-prolyl cis-trans isomerase D [Desulfotalea psychrophila LSv54]
MCRTMLQIFRNKAQSIFIQIIVVVIALVFIFWGVGANMMNKSEAAIVVNGEEISLQQFQQAYDQAFQQLSDQFGGKVPKGMADALGLKDQVVNRLVQQELLRQGGKQMGVQLSAVEIQHAIQAMPQFHKDGAFDVKSYNSILAANRLSPSKFEANIRHDMLAEKTARAINEFSAHASDFEIEEFYGQANEGVSVDFASFSPKDFSSQVSVEEPALAQWFKEAKDNYKKSPEVKLTYLAYDYATIQEKISLDEAAINNYYQSHLNTFRLAEKRHARHILFVVSPGDSDEKQQAQLKKAENVLKKAQADEDFAQLARQFSEGPSKSEGGDLGFFARAEMIPPFADAVFTLKNGDISGIVKTNFGYHIIKLEGIQEAKTKSLDKVREQIALSLQQDQAKALAFQLANNAYEGIIGAGNLQAYTKKHPETPAITTDYFSQQNPPANLKDNKLFLEKAFALGKKELSSLLQTDSGYAVIYVDDINTPATPTLAKVRDRATEDYRNYLANELAKKKAEEFLKGLHEGKETFTTLAEQTGVQTEKTDFLLRQGDSGTFPQTLLEQIFLLSPQKTSPDTIGQADGSYYVYSYIGRNTPSASLTAPEKERYISGILNNKQQMLLSAWLIFQQKNAQIERNQSL